MYFLTIDYPNMRKGEPVSIPGLGTFANGKGTFIGKESADSFRTYQVASGMADRTLLQAFKGSDYVTVEVYDKEKHGEPEIADIPKTSEGQSPDGATNGPTENTPGNTNEPKTGDDDKDGDK